MKKGTGAFKPRAPIARRRPAAPAAAASQQVADESTPTTPAQESTPEAPPPVVETSSTTTAEPSPTVEATERAESGLVAPVTKEPAGSKSKEAVTSTSDNAQPAHAASDGTLPEALPSGPPEKQPTPVQDSIDTTVPASATSSPAKKRATAQAKPSRSTAFAKPKPIAETTEPQPPSARQEETVPAPSGSEVTTPTTDNGEGSSSAPAAPTAGAPKRARKPAAKPRKRKAAATTGESEAETGAETEAPPKKKRAPRKKKDAATTDGGDGGTQASGAENGEAVALKKKRAPRKKKVTAEPAVTDAENGEGEGPRSGDEGEETEAARKLQARRKRSVTPEDAEQQTVDHEQMVMSDLTRDLRIGAKFSKYDELRDRIRKKRARQRLIKLGKLQPGEELPEGEGEGEGGGSESGTPAPADSSKPGPAPKPVPVADEGPSDVGMPRLVMRDGQLTLDEGTTQYDRHAAADAARGVVYEQEEDEFTTAVTQATYMRRQPQGNFWTDEDTVKFYHGLRMFGTDFNTISKMFGGAKNRRQVKLKFNREERAHPAAVNRCIIGEKVVPMALDAVDGADDLEDSKAITDELDRLKQEQEAETRRQEEDKAAENQRRRDELFGKRKGDRAGPVKEHGADDGDDDDAAAVAPKEDASHPSAMYGVGTDPDVIDETDLLPARGRGRGRGGRGRRGGKSAPMFAGGIGA